MSSTISVCRGGAVALHLSTHRNGSELTLEASGVVDLATAGQLRAGIEAALADDAAAGLVVDLDGVTLLDSAGIGALLKGRRLADERDRRYRVTGARGIVAEVLRITGVWAHLVGDAV
jgi:anti-sigma B factor antagonist